MTTAVAISTTGDEHRLGFLETAVVAWDQALGTGDSLFVTVDGDEAACERVCAVLEGHMRSGWKVFQVGQPPADEVKSWDGELVTTLSAARLGVAVNKNTGLELMMDNTRAEHLFLSDDDAWPLPGFGAAALERHTELSDQVPHSMVCWGQNRVKGQHGRYASWSWPRGSVLYTHRSVVETVGGMVEEFGLGGHEHVEWSRRIHQHGLTPQMFCSPVIYALPGTLGHATRANRLWHCEDMRKPGETVASLIHRRKTLTSIQRTPADQEHIEAIMRQMDGETRFVGYRAQENGRASATLCLPSTGRGAGGAS